MRLRQKDFIYHERTFSQLDQKSRLFNSAEMPAWGFATSLCIQNVYVENSVMEEMLELFCHIFKIIELGLGTS